MNGLPWSTFLPVLAGGLLAAVGHHFRSKWGDHLERRMPPGALGGFLKRLVGRMSGDSVAQKARAEDQDEPSPPIFDGFMTKVRAGLVRVESDLRTWSTAGLFVVVSFVVLLWLLHASSGGMI